LHAEEAIGLAKTLSWDIVKGPFWSPDDAVEDPKDENYSRIMHKEDIEKQFKEQNIMDGDYVYTPCFQGVYWKGGVIVDAFASSEEEEDLYDEWHDKLKRESLAKNSLIKVKAISGSTFFTKGKLLEIGEYIKDTKPDIVFMDTLLTPLQQNKLEKRWNEILMGKEDKVRRYMIKAYTKEAGEPTDLDTTTATGTDGESSRLPIREVKVVDRFAVILQIFAQRANSKQAKLQLELAWMNYIKHRLVRDNEGAFTSLTKFFTREVPMHGL